MTGPHSETADNGDAGTRQISVAELLARHGAIDAPAATRRRRRRRGDSDAVTVAELTGEIPIIRDPSRQDRRQDQRKDTAHPAPPASSQHGNGRVQVTERAPQPPAEPATAPPGAQAAAAVADVPRYWSEPEPRWPKSDPRTHRVSGPERSEYPRPRRHTDEGNAAAWPSGAEHMSPDPVGHYGDGSVDVLDSEVREAESAIEASTSAGGYLQASEEPSAGTLFGGQSLADEVARRRGAEQAPAVSHADHRGVAGERVRVPGRWRGKLVALGRGLLIVLQSILAVVFGAGLFIAFDQLWRWNSIVALVLAVLVILGLVVGVRVVRKTEDIASTLIAVAAGALITLGPLALLQSG